MDFYEERRPPLNTTPEAKKFNPLCRKCRRNCRQPAGVLLIDCPRFLPYPFKVATHRYDQLELFGEKP